jgi:hypothetical protein
VPALPRTRGANLTIGACLCAQEASSTCLLPIPHVRLPTSSARVRQRPDHAFRPRGRAHTAHGACPPQGRSRRPFGANPSSRASSTSSARDTSRAVLTFWGRVRCVDRDRSLCVCQCSVSCQ